MEKLGDVEYYYEVDQNGVTYNRQIFWKGQDIKIVLPLLFDRSILDQPFNPYDRWSKRIHFNPEIQTICNDIFPVFVEIRKKDIYGSASMVTNYEDIIKNLLYSLFLSVENL